MTEVTTIGSAVMQAVKASSFSKTAPHRTGNTSCMQDWLQALGSLKRITSPQTL